MGERCGGRDEWGRGVGEGEEENGREVWDAGEGCVGGLVCVCVTVYCYMHMFGCDLFLRQSTSGCLQELCRESIVNWR